MSKVWERSIQRRYILVSLYIFHRFSDFWGASCALCECFSVVTTGLRNFGSVQLSYAIICIAMDVDNE